jgi:hypothetical protein
MAGLPPLAAISSYCLPVSAPREIPCPNCRPAQFGHDLCQSSEGAGGPLALWDFKQV